MPASKATTTNWELLISTSPEPDGAHWKPTGNPLKPIETHWNPLEQYMFINLYLSSYSSTFILLPRFTRLFHLLTFLAPLVRNVPDVSKRFSCTFNQVINHHWLNPLETIEYWGEEAGDLLVTFSSLLFLQLSVHCFYLFLLFSFG